MWMLTLLAEENNLPRADRDPWRQPEVIWGTIALMGVLLVGAAVVYFTDRWRKKSVVGGDRAAIHELTDFRGMYERGEITADEYARLRDRVAGRIRTDPVPPATPETQAPKPNSTPPDPGNPPNPPPPA